MSGASDCWVFAALPGMLVEWFRKVDSLLAVVPAVAQEQTWPGIAPRKIVRTSWNLLYLRLSLASITMHETSGMISDESPAD